MAYADQKQNRTVAIGSVVLVHAALGAGLLSGLMVTATSTPKDPPIKIVEITPDPVPPPPEPMPEPLPRTERLPSAPATITVPEPLVPTNAAPSFPTTTVEYPPLPPLPPAPEAAPYAEPSAPAVNLSRALRPRGDQGAWFPQDSYPPAARRGGAEGRVSVSVDVGADGRVIDCRVTSSSGNADLDGATCRLAKRNGRFEPARDASGAPTASTTALRNVRWVLD